MTNEYSAPKPGTREWEALVSEGWVMSEGDLSNIETIAARGRDPKPTVEEERVAAKLRRESNMPPAPLRRTTANGHFFKLTDEAYQGLRELAAQWGLVRGGGNVTALLELIGQGKLHVVEPDD